MEKRKEGKEIKTLFLDHVTRVSKYVKGKHGITPIIWDDMLRRFYAEELVKSEIGKCRTYVSLVFVVRFTNYNPPLSL
jgi:hypothetical protein